MYELAVEQEIAAGHQLRGYQGKCERRHGHNWRVRIEVAASALDRAGLAVDFGRLKQLLAEILERYDHTMLNDLPEFRDSNPSSENLARLLHGRVREALRNLDPGLRLRAVVVWESPRASVRYHED